MTAIKSHRLGQFVIQKKCPRGDRSIVGGMILLNFQASCAVFPGQEYFLCDSTLGLASKAPVMGLMMQVIGLALRLRVMEMCASTGDCESPCMRAARVLSMNSWTEGSRPSSISKALMVDGSAIAIVGLGKARWGDGRITLNIYTWTTMGTRAYMALSDSIHVWIWYINNSDYYK